MRYGWLHYDPPENATVWGWEISGLRVVCKVKPVNYAASYEPYDAQLGKVWYQSRSRYFAW